MNSGDAFANWTESYGDVIRRGQTKEDVARRLKLARHNLDKARARLAEGDDDQALIHAETCMVNAADAVLARDGYRIRGKTGSHGARFAYPGLPREFAAERRLLGIARDARNVAMYEEAGKVSPSLAQDTVQAATQMLAAAKRALSPAG